MAKKKVHNLKTIEDMCRIVTEENYVRLVMDMADCIGFHIKLKRELTKKEYSELKFEQAQKIKETIESIKILDKRDNLCLRQPRALGNCRARTGILCERE